MRIIKLNAIESTNTFLKQLAATEKVLDYTVVQADYQTNGRGQLATNWQSKPGKNLMFSVFKRFLFLKTENYFYINMVVSLALYHTLKQLQIPDLSIKWPNDILSANYKIAGVLIENILVNNTIKYSIIGVGLNVNQMQFTNLTNASSLKKITGVSYNLNEILKTYIKMLKQFSNLQLENSFFEIKRAYEKYLFRLNQKAAYKDENGAIFNGIIIGVTPIGELIIRDDKENIKKYNLKQIAYIY